MECPAVTGRYTESAFELAIPDAILPASPVLSAFAADSNPKCSDGLYEAMVTGDSKCQWAGWQIGIGSNGLPDAQVEITSRERFYAEVEPCWKRSGNGDPRAVR